MEQRRRVEKIGPKPHGPSFTAKKEGVGSVTETGVKTPERPTKPTCSALAPPPRVRASGERACITFHQGVNNACVWRGYGGPTTSSAKACSPPSVPPYLSLPPPSLLTCGRPALASLPLVLRSLSVVFVRLHRQMSIVDIASYVVYFAGFILIPGGRDIFAPGKAIMPGDDKLIAAMQVKAGPGFFFIGSCGAPTGGLSVHEDHDVLFPYLPISRLCTCSWRGRAGHTQGPDGEVGADITPFLILFVLEAAAMGASSSRRNDEEWRHQCGAGGRRWYDSKVSREKSEGKLWCGGVVALSLSVQPYSRSGPGVASLAAALAVCHDRMNGTLHLHTRHMYLWCAREVHTHPIVQSRTCGRFMDLLSFTDGRRVRVKMAIEELGRGSYKEAAVAGDGKSRHPAKVHLVLLVSWRASARRCHGLASIAAPRSPCPTRGWWQRRWRWSQRSREGARRARPCARVGRGIGPHASVPATTSQVDRPGRS